MCIYISLHWSEIILPEPCEPTPPPREPTPPPPPPKSPTPPPSSDDSDSVINSALKNRTRTTNFGIIHFNLSFQDNDFDDDFEPVDPNARFKKYGKAGRAASKRWFNETQTDAIKNDNGSIKEWFHGIISRRYGLM